MSSFYLHFLTFLLIIHFSFAQISDKRLCVDPLCKSPVSLAKTLGRYFSPDEYRLSFEPNQDVVIYSKSAGSDESLWGVEIKGKRGYIPKSRVRETKSIKKPTLLVDTEITNIPSKPQVPLKEEIVNPSKVKQNFEVIDGTTIYMSAAGEDVASNQDSQVEEATESSDSTKIEFPIDNNHSTEEINLSSENPNSLVSQSGEPKVADSNELGSVIESVNSDDKLEIDNLVNESVVKSSADLNSTENLTESSSQNNTVRSSNSSTNSQQKETIENSDMSTIPGGIGEDTSNIKENTESNDPSVNKLKDQEGVKNPFSFVSNAIKHALDSDRNLDQDVIKQELNGTAIKDDEIDSVKLNKSDLEENKFEPQKQLINADILSINEDSNNLFKEGSPQNKVMYVDSELSIDKTRSSKNDKEIENSSNSIEGDIQHVVPSISKNLLTEKSDNVEKPASQESLKTESEFSSFQASTEEKENVNKVDGEVENNSPANTKSDIYLESVSIKNDFYNSQLKMENQNVKSTVESNFRSNTEKLSVEIDSNSEEKPLAVKDAPSKNEDGVNIVHAASDVEETTGISDDDIASSQNAELVSSHRDDNVFGRKADRHEPTESGFDYGDNVSSELNTVQNPNILSSDLINNQEIPYKETELQNVQGSDLQEDSTESNETVGRTDHEENVEVDPPSIFSYFDHVKVGKHSENDKVEESVIAEELIDTNGNEEFNENVHEGKDVKDETRSENGKVEESVTVEELSDTNGDEEFKGNVHEGKDVKVGIHSENEKVEESVILEEVIDTNGDEENNEKVHEGDFCTKEDCPKRIDPKSSEDFALSMDLLHFNSDVFIYLVTTAVSVIIFLLGHFALDKSRREGPLLVKINKLEKEFLILLKEKEILAQQAENKIEERDHVDSEEFLNLQQEKEILEEKVQNLEDNIQTLEKELENSTEVGLELNRMLSDVLNSENAGQTLMLNIEGLQAQLAEQQGIVSSMKEVLSLKETENYELNLELDIANKKVFDLQCELDKLLSNIIKLEEDKELLEKTSESQIIQFKSTISSLKEQLENNRKEYIKKIEELNNNLSTSEHYLQLKTKEFEGLKSSMKQIKDIKNANTLESLLEVNSIKAELEQLKAECQGHCDRLRKENETNSILEKKVKSTEEQIGVIRTKFDETDKTRLELETKLQVLTNYFKEKEEQLQKELSKYESMWSAKQGEATSTSEKIKYLQSEVQNYKAQNETLKQEIVSQEVELKGQISVLEKKVHENWVSARQAERRLEELKQEAAQLRNRLTLRERTLQDDRLHNRMQSPLEQSSDLPISPLHLESPASPPLLYNSRDHITKSPPMLGMPLPFLPPPTGSSYLPPPPPTGSSYLPPPPLPFMPPPPHDMFPGDHRPPPLGRMSSPPLNSRYSPSRPYSPYDRSPSPSYDESEYGTSPVHRRNYSQFNRRRDHRPAAMEKFNGRSGTLSSGSDNSNESLDEINHHNSKV